VTSSIFLGLLLWMPQAPFKPSQSPAAIMGRAAAEMRKTEPTWQVAGGVCSLPPLLPEEVDLACGPWVVSFDRASAPLAFATVHQVSTSQAVSGWMKGDARRMADVVVPYDLGVPAYLNSSQRSPNVTIIFGKGRFIVTVDGPSRTNVDRIARALLRQIAE
jgi:hypothetical protein